MLIDFFKEFDLLKLSAALFVLGLAALFFIVMVIQPIPMRIEEIGEDDIGKTVTINASVENKVLRDGNLFLELTGDNKSYIKAVMFENDIKALNLSDIRRDGYVNAVGRVERYMGELEIIIKEIKVIG